MSEQIPVVPNPADLKPSGARLSMNALLSTITGIFTYAIYILALIFDIKAIWALILAPISAIVAIVSGHKGKREIRVSAGKVTGNKLANSGLAMGYIYIGLCLLILFLVIVGVAGIAQYINSIL